MKRYKKNPNGVYALYAHNDTEEFRESSSISNDSLDDASLFTDFSDGIYINREHASLFTQKYVNREDALATLSYDKKLKSCPQCHTLQKIVNKDVCDYEGCGKGVNENIKYCEKHNPQPVHTYDPVNKPKHYQLFADGTQAIDIIKASLTPEEFAGYCKGNALKYRLRAGNKDKLQQDIDKADWYANKLDESTGLIC